MAVHEIKLRKTTSFYYFSFQPVDPKNLFPSRERGRERKETLVFPRFFGKKIEEKEN